MLFWTFLDFFDFSAGEFLAFGENRDRLPGGGALPVPTIGATPDAYGMRPPSIIANALVKSNVNHDFLRRKQ